MSFKKIKPTYKPYGNKAILIAWEAKMSQNVLQNVLDFYQKIIKNNIKVILELIQSNNSLLIFYNNKKINFLTLKHLLESVFDDENAAIEIKKQRLWKIPVCYDPKFGVDLQEISIQNKLSVNQIIELHSNAIYQVFSIGFLPGFLYLGGLDKRLFIDRKKEPRLQVKKGAVGIGGKQTGIYPKESPGGWQIIGNCPLRFFDVSKNPPCFIVPGDKIRFIPISMQKHEEILNAIKKNKYQLQPEAL